MRISLDAFPFLCISISGKMMTRANTEVCTQSPAHALIPWHSWLSWECPHYFKLDASYNYVYTHWLAYSSHNKAPAYAFKYPECRGVGTRQT